MALNITTPITLKSGIELTTSFARVSVVDGEAGTHLNAAASLYPSSEQFENGKNPILDAPIELYASKAYNRDVDGVDILDLAHDIMIEAFQIQGITATKELGE